MQLLVMGIGFLKSLLVVVHTPSPVLLSASSCFSLLGFVLVAVASVIFFSQFAGECYSQSFWFSSSSGVPLCYLPVGLRVSVFLLLVWAAGDSWPW